MLFLSVQSLLVGFVGPVTLGLLLWSSPLLMDWFFYPSLWIAAALYQYPHAGYAVFWTTCVVYAVLSYALVVVAWQARRSSFVPPPRKRK